MSQQAGLAPEALRERIAAQGGRVTPARMAVLGALSQAQRPLSQDELAVQLRRQGLGPDRVTLYRTLDWLVGQGLAQRVVSAERAALFEFVRTDAHRHAHFQCERCGRIRCLEGVAVTAGAEVPAGYRIARAELVFHGTCPDCDR